MDLQPDLMTSFNGEGHSAIKHVIPGAFPDAHERAVPVSIVIPAYNEEERISDSLITIVRFLESWPVRTELVVVDDGSTDGTAAILGKFAVNHPNMKIVTNSVNCGKGASVKHGMLAATGKYIFAMDADLSVPIDELAFSYEVMQRYDYPILIGSRKVPGASVVHRQPWLRESLGSGFTMLARLLLYRKIVDFTCGFKGFRRDVARLIFALQRRSDWAYDAENLYLAKLLDIPVHQHPVRWEHREGSRVRFPRDIIRTLGGLISIRWHSPRLVTAASKGFLVALPVETANTEVNSASLNL